MRLTTKIFLGTTLLILSAVSSAEATAPCTSYTNISNGTLADASVVMNNFNCAARTGGSTLDGTTFTGQTAFPGATTITAAGNLGIGLSNPNEALVVGYGPEVLAGTYAGIGSTSANSGTILGQGPGSNLVTRWLYNATPANGVGQFYTAGYANRIEMDGSSISLNANSNRAVGINTITAPRSLTVSNLAAGTSEATFGGSIQIEGSPDINAGNNGIEFKASVAGAGYGWLIMSPDRGNSNAPLVFASRASSATWTERMTFRTDSSNVGINTSAPNYTLQVNGSVAGTSAYVNLSDARLKKDVVPLVGAMSIVEKLNGVRFKWRSNAERAIGKAIDLPVNAPQVGFIAQDVRTVLPEAVTIANDRDHTMSMAELKIVPVLVEALKELKAANDNEVAQINHLQTQVSELQNRARIKMAGN